MQFFTLKDETNIKHKVLLLPLSDTEMNEVSGQCAKCMPSIAISSLIQLGHPYVIVDFGGADAWKTAIALDEVSEDGHKVGDELAMGDVLTVILTSKSKAANISKDKVYMKVPLEEVLVFSFLYTADMAQNYAVYKMYQKSKK
ncbi:MAG TPA: hypothetical protein VLU95_00065 [Candidatus Acidoferrum sp.]|nr:hypothetical protein [Candidatus Acidoferrum sp.]